MRKLGLSEWANIAEILASVFIVFSLAYVGLEIQQNTQAIQNESHQNVITMLNDQQMALTTNDELFRIFLVAEDTPNTLSEEDWLRFVEFMYPRIGVWEYLFLAKQEGTIAEGTWVAFEPYFLSIICKPGYLRWWSEYGQTNARDFLKYIETQVLPTCSKGD